MPVITVNKNNTYRADDVFQWDANRALEIYGLNLSALPEIHFANSKMSKAIVKQATSYANGVIKVEIPNILLETAIPIRVFVCVYEGEEFISRYSFTVNVKARPKPEDYIAEDDEKIYSYNALENLVNNTVTNLETQYNEINSKYAEAVVNLNTATNTLETATNTLETATSKAEQAKKNSDSAAKAYNDASDMVDQFLEDSEDILATLQTKANKSTVAEATLSASGWSGNTYSFESDYPVATYDIEIALNSTATADQAEAFNSTQIVGSATSNIVTAFGDVPTVDIPIIIKAVVR